MNEVYNADARGLEIIRMILETDGSDEAVEALVAAIRAAIAECGAEALVQMTASHAAAMSMVASPNDASAFLSEYEEFATLNRMRFAADRDQEDPS